MTLLVIADDELLASRLPEWRADLLVSCGDVPDDVILRVGEKCACRQIVAVKGNHDSSRSFPAPVQDLHLKTLEICRVRFGGFCGAWKYKPAGHYLFEQAEVEKAMSSFPSVDIFVAHNSPRLFHDQDGEGPSGLPAFPRHPPPPH